MKTVLAILLVLTFANTMKADPAVNPILVIADRMNGPKPEIKIKLGEQIKDFQMEDVGGNIVDTQKLRKDKKLLFIRIVNIDDVIWEWETNNIREISERFKNEVVVLDIVIGVKDPAKVIEKYENSHVGYNLALDKKNTSVAQFGIKEENIPSLLIFDKDGKLIDFGRIVPLGFSEILDKFLQKTE